MHWWHLLSFPFIVVATSSQLETRQVDPAQIAQEGVPKICTAWCEVVAGEYNQCKTSTDPTCFCGKKAFRAFETCGNCMLAAQRASREEVFSLQKTYSSLSNICIGAGKASSPLIASTKWRPDEGAVAVGTDPNGARDLFRLCHLAWILGTPLVVGTLMM